MTEGQFKPSVGEVICALRRMIAAADERGHYSFDGLDARWAEAAIDLICDAHHHGETARKPKEG